LYLVGETLQPTHNSLSAEDFIAWVSGKNPDMKTIYSAFSDQLSTGCNLNLQRTFTSAKYRRIFPNVQVNAGRYVMNQELIEFVGREGSFRNTTVNGSVTGMELHLGVIDDPVKGRAEAKSPTTRNRTWDWLTDDFFTRFAENSGLLFIMTRWDIDDVLGRFINTTVNGSVTGMELHLGVIDDPVKGRAEAKSPTTRNRTWDWLTDDFFTRFAGCRGALQA
jgi:hypothetical protein